MKTVFFLLALAELAFAWNVPQEIHEEWIRVASPHYSECICASGADSAKAINVLGELEYPNDPCLKCFIKCIAIKMGLILSDGTIIEEAWIRIVAGVTPEIAVHCTNITNNILDICEKSYEWSKCVVNAVSIN